MKTISKDARGFIDGVAKYMRGDSRGRQLLPKVTTLFGRVTSAAKKERVASVATVVPLSSDEKTAVQAMLERKLGHDVECQYRESRELLGGMKIQVADWVVDTSLSGQLADLTSGLI